MSDSKDLAVRVKDQLLSQQQLIKRASADLNEMDQKVANLELENSVLRDTLDLVTKGIIDPAAVPEKLAEFLSDPEQIEVIKKAIDMNLQVAPSLGTPVGEAGPSEEADPLTRFLSEQIDR
jgi:hypothetical protein